MKKSIYNFSVDTIDGEETNLSEYPGKIFLIVNVASQCSFTRQYEGLEKLYRKYRGQGLVVFGFPCNQFGNQEPGSDAEIKEFCINKYQITFPIFSKIEVNGPNTHRLYAFLKQKLAHSSGEITIEWNFTKFLIDANGKILKYYAPNIEPERLEQDIINAL
jgi:glutathione peroxidase